MKKLKQYFICMILCILAVNFLVSMISALSNNSAYLFASRVAKNPKAEEIVELGQDVEKTLEKTIDDIKEKNGDDYPALGIFYYQAIQHYSSMLVVQNFIFSLIAGFALGNIIFLFFFSELKSYKIVVMLIFALFVTSIFLAISDVYTAISNNEEAKFGIPQILWNMEVTSLFYFIVCLVTLGINKLYNTYHEIRYS